MRTLLLLAFAATASAADVPVGEVTKYTFEKSKIFPGTTRDYWIYIPKQYDGKTPACLYVNQDGIQFNAVKLGKDGKATEGGVLDQLIAERKMPVTIAVFVRPGVVKAVLPNALDRFNRSYEYDGLGDNYARFLLEELLPDVETKTASDGRKIVLSKDGNDRGIGGSSSGAVCAFTAAWERPDAFRRVFSSIGTYVGLRGANEYSTIIRKYEPKPLRIYLEDGSGDLNIYGGDWWMANQSMERSLKFMGYEVEHNWGTGGHNGQHATQIFPEAMTWLWKDHPNPVKTGDYQNDFLKEILIPGEEWKLVGEGYVSAYGIAANEKGNIVFSDSDSMKTYKVVRDQATLWNTEPDRIDFQCFGPGGRIYVIDRRSLHLKVWDAPANDTVSSKNIKAYAVVALHDGSIYASISNSNNIKASASSFQIVRIIANGEITVVDDASGYIHSLAISPDQSLIYVASPNLPWVYSYQIQPDGSLRNKQAYYRLHTLERQQDFMAGGMRCDRDGRLWVGSRIGLQVCDQAGRVHCILPMPIGKACNLAFGGPDFDTVYVTCDARVYSRKVKVKGANPFEAPIKPPPPKL